jgi:IclR family transcriptional regulator, acetate operon repressor
MGILDAVARGVARPADIARECDLALSTVARLMQQMADEGLLERDARDGGYALGSRLYGLVRSGANNVDPTLSVRPVLAEVRDLTEETTSLHVRNAGQRVCIAEVQSRHELRRVIPLGLALPLRGSATGDVLLAWAPRQEYKEELTRLALESEERREYQQHLAQVRTQGWSVVPHDWLDGVTGASVPVLDQGVAIAALSVAGPSFRFTLEVAESYVGHMQEAAVRLADKLALRA